MPASTHPLPIEETTEELWDAQIDINLKGSFFMVKAVAPVMKAKGAGKIVNVASTLGLVGSSGGSRLLRVQGRPDDPDQGALHGACAARDQRQRGRSRRDARPT